MSGMSTTQKHLEKWHAQVNKNLIEFEQIPTLARDRLVHRAQELSIKVYFELENHQIIFDFQNGISQVISLNRELNSFRIDDKNCDKIYFINKRFLSRAQLIASYKVVYRAQRRTKSKRIIDNYIKLIREREREINSRQLSLFEYSSRAMSARKFKQINEFGFLFYSRKIMSYDYSRARKKLIKIEYVGNNSIYSLNNQSRYKPKIKTR